MTTIANPARLSRRFSAVLHPQAAAAAVQSCRTQEKSFAQILDESPDIRTLRKLHSKLIRGLGSIPSHILLKLMKAYSDCGQPGKTRQLFDQSPKRDVVYCNVMIRSYLNNRLYQEALLAYKNFAALDVTPDHYTFPCVLKACSGLVDLSVGLQIHTPVVKKGLDSNLYVGNGLIAMYGKCNCLVESRKVFDEMPVRDVVSWNSMVAAYAQNGLFEGALDVCRNMLGFRIQPDAATMAALLPAVTNTSASNVMFLKDLFSKVIRESLVSWNVMLAVYVKNSMPTEAIELYLRMESCGQKPDSITIATVLPACGDLSALSLGRSIHEYVKKNKIQPNLSVENALIDMYAKCGSVGEARKVFDDMMFRDVVSWTSIISAYGMSGDGHNAVAFFYRMMELGLTPDSISFVPVLSACSHGGLLDEGKHLFRLMTEEYKIVPRIEHFACMVDLLGRAGRVYEAYNFIEEMTMTPNDRIWGALLNACRVHANMDIGLVAADHLFQLVPEQAGYYVLLSNIYAKAGRWKEVTAVRSVMKERGIKKEPGISNVEIGKKVHTFLAGDQEHPQSKEIYEYLEVLVGKMRGLGYVPETDSALHDVEEEDKEYHLAVHSEKLAIAFAIISTQPHTSIRITKNLRVCEDCHIAAKLISKIAEREIILRDTHRFHHFKDGICSCTDYW